MVAMSKNEGIFGKLIPYVREVIVLVMWSYLIIKVFLFDVDVYFIDNYFPYLLEYLSYKVFFELTLVAFSWIVLGSKRFLKFCSFFCFYPFFVIFWRVPKILVKNWDLSIVFLPAMFDLFMRAKHVFLMATAVIVSCFCAIVFDNKYTIYASFSILLVCYVIYIRRAIIKAYRLSAFSAIAKEVSKVRQKIENDSFLEMFSKTPDFREVINKENPKEGVDGTKNRKLAAFYILHSLSSLLSERMEEVSNSGKIEIYIIISWINSIVFTWIVFAVKYMCIYKVDNGAFSSQNPNQDWGVLAFLSVSFGRILPNNISQIMPVSEWAVYLSYFEVVCAFLLLVVFLRTMFTTMRENYKKDLVNVSQEVDKIALIVQDRCQSLYDMAISEVEAALLKNETAMVTQMRKLRGLPELTLERTDSDEGNQKKSENLSERIDLNVDEEKKVENAS